MEEVKQQFIDVAYSEFGIKAIESINFEQAFAILDKMQQLRLGTVVGRSEQLKAEYDRGYRDAQTAQEQYDYRENYDE